MAKMNVLDINSGSSSSCNSAKVDHNNNNSSSRKVGIKNDGKFASSPVKSRRSPHAALSSTNGTPQQSPSKSPVRPLSPQPSQQRHYAGCKWTEPPSPSALPPPPKHWTQQQTAAHHHSFMLSFRNSQINKEYVDVTSQLKVLLKVQA